MSNDPAVWQPKIKRVEAPALSTAAQPAQIVVVLKAESDPPPPPPPPPPQQPKAPRAWRFVPERDADNLIIEIIATPIP